MKDKLFMLVLVLLMGYMLNAKADAPLRGFPTTTNVENDTAGAAEYFPVKPVTLDKTSFDWEICNTNTTVTNTLTVKFCMPGQTESACGSNDAFTLRGNFCYGKKEVPVSGMIVEQAGGTPVFQIVYHY